MCFSEARAERHVETAAGSKCSALHHAVRQSSREHDSLTGTQRESIPREAYLPHGRKSRAGDDFKRNFKLSKALQMPENSTHGVQVFSREHIIIKIFRI